MVVLEARLLGTKATDVALMRVEPWNAGMARISLATGSSAAPPPSPSTMLECHDVGIA